MAETAGVVPGTNGTAPETKKRGRGRPKAEEPADRRIAFRITEAEERLTNELLIKLGYEDARQFFLEKLVEVAESAIPEHQALLRHVKKRTLPPWELCPKCDEIGVCQNPQKKKLPAYLCPSCGTTWMVLDRERRTTENYLGRTVPRYR